MNQSCRSIAIITFFLICTFAVSFTQTHEIILLDKITKDPVSFAFVYSGRYNTVSDSVGGVFIPECLGEERYTVSHINYNEYVFNCDSIELIDTIYLRSQSFNLDQVMVVEKRSETDLYKLLDKVLEQYRKSKYADTVSYNYLLRTIKNNKVVERISSNISVFYKVGSDCIFPDKWLNYGKFEFTREAPFLSLDVDQFIVALQPFHYAGYFKLLTSGRIRKNKYLVELIGCNLCDGDQIKLIVKSKEQSCALVVDLLKYKIVRASYVINSNAELSFFRVADGSDVLFDKLVLNVEFDEFGVPLVIDGEISLDVQDIPVQTKFILYQKAPNNSQSFMVLGRPKFTNIYQQLAFQPGLAP